ncbi:Eisosome 1 [Pyrenophora seminiperda CCB06]|uniref:Eisosome 1 n=1 Tax=Pyrenophora seminiperda CCB06 TaxID=1302712 RepID=A0A3M7ME22_9PLEO|nr:Eisosome 1 [Pyrenophora seminiperda CCB06]
MANTALAANAPHASDNRPTGSMIEAAPPRFPVHTKMHCPDPSAHQPTSSRLQNQASAAALYSHNPPSPIKANESRSSASLLEADGKLSSASAATSLKYAKAQDLPSYPVVGIDTKSSAGAAALLAAQNKSSPGWWKPEQSKAAGKAALIANGYKTAPAWRPEASTAGPKAALLAHRDAVKTNTWQPEASADGHSAATIAMRKKAPSPSVSHGYTDQGRKNAFTAAADAHSASRRLRARSNPTLPPLYPDAHNSAKNALGAATLAHSASTRAKKQASAVEPNRLGYGAMEAARIQHAKSISRDMYTSAPPVSLETEEKKHNDALRASAISMAKKIYNVQQQSLDLASGNSTAHTGAAAAHIQQPATGESDIKQQAMRYIGIQEAAQKLAQERLAKIGFDENAAYRSYYGYEQPTRSKLTMRRGRNRAHSASETVPTETSDSDEDDFRSRRIRSQMDQFNKQLADVDAKKRENDRKSLLVAAQRRVQAQMQGMDKKIYDETGKMSSTMIDEWDEKARKRAVANSEARMENHGRVHIGNGKWMDQAEIDAIAQARIQPTLDEITEKTEKRLAEDEKRRAEEEERRLDMEHEKRRIKSEKERATEIKAEEKQGREDEKKAAKARAAEEKTAAKQDKEAEKMRKLDETRLAREQHKSKEIPVADSVTEDATVRDNKDLYYEPTPPTDVRHTFGHEPTDMTSPTSPGSSKGFKSLLGKLKRRSKHHSPAEPHESTKENDTAFVGGATLRNSASQAHSQSQSSKSAIRTPTESGGSNEADHSIAASRTKPAYVPHVDNIDGDCYSNVSSLSSDGDMLDVTRGRSVERVVSGGTVTSGGDSFEEARDHFDENLVPPPAFGSEAENARQGSPSRESKFQEIGL